EAGIAIERRLSDAARLLGIGRAAQEDMPRDSNARDRITSYMHDRPGAVWINIHRADELLMLVASHTWIYTRAMRLKSRFAGQPLDPADPSVSTYKAFLDHVAGPGHSVKRGADKQDSEDAYQPEVLTYSPGDRALLLSILKVFNKRDERAQDTL